MKNTNQTAGLPEMPPIPIDTPDLSNVPRPVAARIEDMWRAGSILMDFVALKRQKDRYAEALRQAAMRVGQLHLPARVTDDGSLDNCRALLRETATAIWDDWESIQKTTVDEILEDPCSEEHVSNWVDTTPETCARLALETQLMCFRRAFEEHTMDREAWNGLRSIPLIICLHKLRNFAVHQGVLEPETRAHEAVLLDESGQKTSTRLRFPSRWFFDVNADDLRDRHSPKLSLEQAKRFGSITKKHPAHDILRAAVEEICRFFSQRRT